MMYKRLCLFVSAILVYGTGMGGERFSANASQTQPVLRLWILATDENYQNARMVAFDMADQHIVEEIKLPPDLAIISAVWSPDGNYIGAVVGEPFNGPVLYGEKVCVFSSAGEQILCHAEPLLAVGEEIAFVAPVSIVWTAASQELVFVTGEEADRLQRNVHVVILDVKHETVTQVAEIAFLGDNHAWEWLGSTQAVVIADDIEPHTFQLFSVHFQPNLSVELLITYTVPFKTVFLLKNNHIAIRRRLINPDGHAIDVMRVEDSHLVLFRSLRRLEYQGTPVPASGGFALSNNGDLLAITSYFHLAGDENPQIRLLVANFETGETSLIGGSPFLKGQLTWSPDDMFIAVKVCAGPTINTQCHIEIFSLDGTVISVDTGFPENRDPMWVNR